ncbi:MAG: DNA repair exonuclease [Clostridiales bacterium]|jgi:DNA repair exonuclease SbcCD nuclease subunit|nr:DNA repair exonuclease [Eubacteriales bacterium]MDH7567077.1 DNA repair exonuclease [Clostridiales bacterium]
MREVKFLHCADLHLDAPFTSLGSDGVKSSIRRNELKQAFQGIIEAAEREKVDLLLISGDLYNHDYVKKSTINFINDGFHAIAPIKVFIIPGNHDPYVANSSYRSFQWSENVYILTEETPCAVFDSMGICVYGAGLGVSRTNGPAFSHLGPVDPDYINILLFHGTVDMNIGQNAYNPVESKVLSSLGMDYVALGHFHNRKDDMGGTGTVYNPGSPDPLGFDEPGEHGFYLGTVTDLGDGKRSKSIRFVRLNKRFYADLDVYIDGCGTDEQVIQKIQKAAADAKIGTDDCLSVVLKGYPEREFKPDIFHVKRHLKDRFFYIKIKDETSPYYNIQEIMKEPGIRGLFARKIFLRLSQADNDDEKQVLADAFRYGMEALEKGKVDL